jgi:hypothetical protein
MIATKKVKASKRLKFNADLQGEGQLDLQPSFEKYVLRGKVPKLVALLLSIKPADAVSWVSVLVVPAVVERLLDDYFARNFQSTFRPLVALAHVRTGKRWEVLYNLRSTMSAAVKKTELLDIASVIGEFTFDLKPFMNSPRASASSRSRRHRAGETPHSASSRSPTATASASRRRS